MRIIVIGEYNQPFDKKAIYSKLVQIAGKQIGRTEIVVGDIAASYAAENAAMQFARKFSLRIHVIFPDWDKPENKYIDRNRQMISFAKQITRTKNHMLIVCTEEKKWMTDLKAEAEAEGIEVTVFKPRLVESASKD